METFDPLAKLIDVLIWWPAFVFSSSFHEAAHAWTAKRGGDLTAYEGGQVTLDPIPHIRRAPFGMVLVPLVTIIMGGFMIGWASTPYNPIWARRYPHRSAWMSLAGPLANLVLVILAFALIKLGLSTGLFQETDLLGFSERLISPENDFLTAVASVLTVMFFLNIILFVLNLIPVPPLDGAEAILLLFPEEYAPAIREKMAYIGIFGIVIAWVILDRIGGFILGFSWLLV